MFRKAMTIEEATADERASLFSAAENVKTLRHSPATDETEFENFYGEHARPLLAYVRRVVAGDGALADDIVQESFLRFLGAPHKGSDFNGKAYLYRIATNLAYDYFRRSARDAKSRTVLETGKIAYEPFAASSSDAARVFDRMKMQERALLWLAYVEGRSHREIAEALNLKALSVRVLLFRARRRLAGLLTEEEE